MNIHLAKALQNLPAAKEVPSVAQVEAAPNHTQWKGVAKEGEWELVKNSSNSFTTRLGTN